MVGERGEERTGEDDPNFGFDSKISSDYEPLSQSNSVEGEES